MITTEEQYAPVGAEPMAPLCYLGIEQDSPYGQVIDSPLNLVFTTTAGITSQQINISSYAPWFLTAIYVYCSTGTVYVKPYDGRGNEIFTDFFLSNPAGTDPFPIIPPYPFEPNDNLRFDVLDAVGGNVVEVIFRGYTLGSAPTGGFR
jgi:hypothetical protein